jgi:DNA-binding transcriptional regulator YhcF (GntR family)
MPAAGLRREPPLHVQIRDHYADLIAHGKMVQGDQLPPVRELTCIWDVAHNTAARAVELMAAEGLVETRGRAGTYVTGRMPSHADHPTGGND